MNQFNIFIILALGLYLMFVSFLSGFIGTTALTDGVYIGGIGILLFGMAILKE